MLSTRVPRLSAKAAACLVLIAIAFTLFVRQKRTSASIAAPETPASLLAEANRLSWAGNWYRAGDFYSRAESFARATGDRRNEVYARVGRIRAIAQTMPWDEVSKALSDQLNDPIVRGDARLRLWCLAAQGYTGINMDSGAAKRSWTEALQIANALGEKQWAARATGELGVIAFLEGDTASA